MNLVGLACAIVISALAAGPLEAAEPASIVVTGNGTAHTQPDLANVTFEVRGEGATPDAATLSLVKKREAVETSIVSIEGAKLAVTSGRMGIEAVRGKDCKEDYEDSPKLSTGDCAVMGHVATIQIKAKVSPASIAGTVVGVAARLGAEEATVSSFEIRDEAGARRRAVAAALVDAKEKARAIAEGTGGHLGVLISVKDSAASFQPHDDLMEVQVTAQPRLQPRPPVSIELKPEPIATSAQLVATYTVAP